jgi:hypothetical protein
LNVAQQDDITLILVDVLEAAKSQPRVVAPLLPDS